MVECYATEFREDANVISNVIFTVNRTGRTKVKYWEEIEKKRTLLRSEIV